jgi:hypothetical protein
MSAAPLRAAALGLSLVVLGCGQDQSPAPDASTAAQAQPAAESAPARTVRILQPASASEVEGPNVTVVLEVDGMMIRPAGDTTANSGHHHLYLDADLTDPSMPVPTVPGSIIHMGDGSSEFTFEGVEPGTHRVIAVVADFAHFPLQPWVVDTVEFVVR